MRFIWSSYQKCANRLVLMRYVGEFPFFNVNFGLFLLSYYRLNSIYMSFTEIVVRIIQFQTSFLINLLCLVFMHNLPVFLQQNKMSYNSFPFATRETFARDSKESYPEHIKRMLFQVSKTVKQFLENLSYIYKSNGINFKIKEYHGVLMRMLSPFELLTHFGYEKNEKLFYKINNIDESFKSLGKNTSLIRWDENQSYQDNFDIKRQDSQFRNDLESSEMRDQFQEPIVYRNHDNSLLRLESSPQAPKFIGREPVLGLDMQLKLCEWIREQIASKKGISNTEISQRARSLANNPRFAGSKGWLKRFLGRHPDIYKLIEISKCRFTHETRRFDGKPFGLNEEEKDGNNYEEIKQEENIFKGDWYRAHNIYQVSQSEVDREMKNNKIDNCQYSPQKQESVRDQQPEMRKKMNSTKSPRQEHMEILANRLRQDKEKQNGGM